MPKTVSDSYAQKLSLYERLVATNSSVRRKGATMPYTSVNGHMFSLLTKEGRLALRLPTAERELFLEKYQARLSEQYGVVLKEYVEVPDALLEETAELRELFDLSLAYVSSLKPNPTKKTAGSKKP